MMLIAHHPRRSRSMLPLCLSVAVATAAASHGSSLSPSSAAFVRPPQPSTSMLTASPITTTSMMASPSLPIRRRLRRRTAAARTTSIGDRWTSLFADAAEDGGEGEGAGVGAADPADIQAKLKAQMAKLQERDRSSKVLKGDDLDVVHEDEHIVVVNKPSGVLTVPGKEGNPSLGAAVFERYGCESNSADRMIVHRLGMDTSGLVVFARTNAALRAMNTLFRTRKIVREYEALVCGKVSNDSGSIDLPLMRDYEYPPFMRVSTDERQRALVGLTADEVGKKILESPKDCRTEYSVLSSEDVGGHAVARLKLASVSGRTHQLNVHCAAIGHPIVGDGVYGYGGETAPNGGLDASELPADAASVEEQKAIAEAVAGKPMCVHAKSISFEHPVTKEKLSFECSAPF